MESEWLQEAIRISLKASAYHTALDEKPGPPQARDPRLRKLVEGIQFSRRLILTYHFVILGLVFLFSALHWTRKLVRRRRRHLSKLNPLDYGQDFDGESEPIKHPSSQSLKITGEPGSSDSSTTSINTTPTRKDIDEDEETPLLQNTSSIESQGPRRTLVSTFKSILAYQPPPIPVVNKVLPSNGTSIVLLTFVALNLFYIFYHINFNLFELFVLADRLGLVFVANLPLLYILAAKSQPLKIITGRSYESLNIFHRRLGELLCLEALLHSSGMIAVWYTLIRPNGFELIRFLMLNVILLGIGAFFCYELLYFTSLASFRHRWYELFLGLHIVLQIAALVFVFFHHTSSRPYVGLALAIFLVDRLVYRLWAKSLTIEANTKVLKDEDTIRVSSLITLQPQNPLLNFFGFHNLTAGWQPTDHVFITIPSLSQKHLIQAHPFTIASQAPIASSPSPQSATLALLIRAQDGFSRDLLNASYLHKTLTIRLSGPYGSSSSRDLLSDSDLAVVIAGGSGIAVTWPLIHFLLSISRSSDTEIASIGSLQRRIVLIWVVRDEMHVDWIGKKAIEEVEGKGVQVLIPEATDEVGRPDLGGIVEEILRKEKFGARMRVVASGPDGMGRCVRNVCAGLIGRGHNVEVEVEKFGW